MNIITKVVLFPFAILFDLLNAMEGFDSNLTVGEIWDSFGEKKQD